MPQTFSFSVSIHLDSLFTDKRSRCKLYVSSEHQETVGDFLLKIRKSFNINDPIDLYIEDFETLYYIPPCEDVRILQSNNIIVVKRICDEDTKNGEKCQKTKIKKRKRALSIEYKNEDEANDNTSYVKEKAKKKDKTINKKDLSNMFPITTMDIKEIVNKEKVQKDTTLSNEGILKNNENIHQSDYQADDVYSIVTYMETDQQNALQNETLPSSSSTISNNTKDCDYRKIYEPSYSTTTFKTLGSVATSRKHTFTERKPVETLKISTTPKLIQPIKVIDKEIPRLNKNIEETQNISVNSICENTLEALKDGLNKANFKSSLELPHTITEHSDDDDQYREIITTKTENSPEIINSTPILIDSSINNADIRGETEKCDLNYFTANFVTKRKRKRHRKKKSCVNLQTDDNCKLSLQNETPRTSVKPSTPLIHIKFGDGDDDQTNQNSEKREDDFKAESQQLVDLESSKLETYSFVNKKEIKQNTTNDASVNNNYNILEEKNRPEKQKSGEIRILSDIKICNSLITNFNDLNKTSENVVSNKNNNECHPTLLNSNTNCNGKVKPKTTPKCTDKRRISTAMQRAINNYFKDLNGNGALKKETTQYSDSSNSSSYESSSESSYSCNDAESNFTENRLKSNKKLNLDKIPTILDKKQCNGNNKYPLEKVHDNVNLDKQHLEECSLITTKEVFSPFLISESEILKKSLMDSKPMKDNIIAFKKVVLTENYTPEVSQFIIAKVLDFQTADNVIKFYVLNGGDQLNQPKGKFSLEEDTEETSTKEVICKWEDVLEPRLLYS